MNQLFYFFIFIGAALAAVIFLFYRILILEKKIKNFLGDGQTPEDFQATVIRKIMRLEAGQEEAAPKIKILEDMSAVSVQKVGFLRFNPFDGTGGDNSFILVLLDHNNDGVLLSSLYARDGVRVYGKQIAGGKSKQNLSGEEKEVLEETIFKGIRN